MVESAYDYKISLTSVYLHTLVWNYNAFKSIKITFFSSGPNKIKYIGHQNFIHFCRQYKCAFA